jgi:hypothetical protein
MNGPWRLTPERPYPTLTTNQVEDALVILNRAHSQRGEEDTKLDEPDRESP